ncbi:MAG: hypothetical protein JNJ56_14665, partial [Ignavibacteria bacterium]|nr:hypothetical protein [Ignavibacteria bacterium]
MEIYQTTNGGYSFTQVCPTITIDWIDFNYPYYENVNGGEDLFIFINSVENISLNNFQWSSNADGELIKIFGEDSPLYPEGNIQVYKQYHSFDTVRNEWVGYNLHNEHPRSLGNSFSDNYFLDYPVDGRNLLSPYTIPTHLNSGEINGNLTLLQNVNTLQTLLDYPTNFTIKKRSYFKISSGKIFNLITPTSSSVNFTIEDSAYINLGSDSKLIVESLNKLILKNKSNLILQTNSEIRFKTGSLFCNEGARIVGNGSIVFEKGYHQFNCTELADFMFEDSTRIILEDSAVVEIPDNINFHLKGINTSLIMNPNSKIKFGENAKILCDNGA